MMSTDSNILKPWVVVAKPRPTAPLKLICFAYAGGNANAFRTWADKLPQTIEVLAIELPGRASRFNEDLMTSMADILQALEKVFVPYLNMLQEQNQYYVFFGHSMGATLAFELSRRLRQRSCLLPEKLILSARRAPSYSEANGYGLNDKDNVDTKAHALTSNTEQKKRLHDLPRAEFLEHLEKLNGTPKAVLDNQELLDLMEPILRSDFQVLEEWEYAETAPLDIPFFVLTGEQDEYVTHASVLDWQKESEQKSQFISFSGDHFFLLSQEAQLVNYLQQLLAY